MGFLPRRILGAQVNDGRVMPDSYHFDLIPLPCPINASHVASFLSVFVDTVSLTQNVLLSFLHIIHFCQPSRHG